MNKQIVGWLIALVVVVVIIKVSVGGISNDAVRTQESVSPTASSEVTTGEENSTAPTISTAPVTPVAATPSPAITNTLPGTLSISNTSVVVAEPVALDGQQMTHPISFSFTATANKEKVYIPRGTKTFAQLAWQGFGADPVVIAVTPRTVDVSDAAGYFTVTPGTPRQFTMSVLASNVGVPAPQNATIRVQAINFGVTTVNPTQYAAIAGLEGLTTTLNLSAAPVNQRPVSIMYASPANVQAGTDTVTITGKGFSTSRDEGAGNIVTFRSTTGPTIVDVSQVFANAEGTQIAIVPPYGMPTGAYTVQVTNRITKESSNIFRSIRINGLGSYPAVGGGSSGGSSGGGAAPTGVPSTPAPTGSGQAFNRTGTSFVASVFYSIGDLFDAVF